MERAGEVVHVRELGLPARVINTQGALVVVISETNNHLASTLGLAPVVNGVGSITLKGTTRTPVPKTHKGVRRRARRSYQERTCKRKHGDSCVFFFLGGLSVFSFSSLLRSTANHVLLTVINQILLLHTVLTLRPLFLLWSFLEKNDKGLHSSTEVGGSVSPSSLLFLPWISFPLLDQPRTLGKGRRVRWDCPPSIPGLPPRFVGCWLCLLPLGVTKGLPFIRLI